MGLYFYWHDFQQHPDYPAGRPDLLKRMDGSAIAILATVNVVRAFLWYCEMNHVFWIVRNKKVSESNDMETTEPYGR